MLVFAIWLCLSLLGLPLSGGSTNQKQGKRCGKLDQMALALHPRDWTGQAGASARAFLWKHWSEQSCAQLDLTTWTREGVKAQTRYSIEFSKSGSLVLRETSHRWATTELGPPDGRPVPVPASDDSYEVYTVERVRTKVPFDVEEAELIPKGSASPAHYQLRFRDKNGKVITGF
jgi:hypothetical protein